MSTNGGRKHARVQNFFDTQKQKHGNNACILAVSKSYSDGICCPLKLSLACLQAVSGPRLGARPLVTSDARACR